MNKKVLIIMNPLESINLKKDTTYQLMLAAKKIGYEVSYLIPGSLAIKNLEPIGSIVKLKLFLKKIPTYQISEIQKVKLSCFNYILMRLDPPVDNNYFYVTYILDLIKNKDTQVINSGYSLRNYNEKLIALNFPKHIPDTILTRNKKDVIAFREKHKNVILKPLNLMGGRSIYFISESDKNLNVIFEDMTNLGQDYILVQKYLKEARKGDKRIIIINGKVIEKAVIRISNKNDHRSNLASGGFIKKYTLSKKELIICQEVANFLYSENIYFAGIDMIGNKITEINITSPTCVAEINKFHGINLGKIFWEFLK